MKSCEVNGCKQPSFGKDKKTGTRYCTAHQYLRTDLDRRSPYQKHIDKQKEESGKSNTASKVRGLASLPVNKKMVSDDMARKQLLLLADNLFGNKIKKRDADSGGYIICPCCGGEFHLEETDPTGKKIVQPLHFVDRDVYSQRFNEEQVYAGCSYCNLKQHLDSKGPQYRRFKAFLVEKLGTEKVSAIEADENKINRLSKGDIETIIAKYKNEKNNNSNP